MKFAKSVQFKRLAAAALAAAPAAAGAQSAPVGYTVSNYATGLAGTSPVTSLGIDLSTRTLYYADANFDPAPLRKISAAGAVTTVNADFPAAASFPYEASDLQYFNGYVFATGFDGKLFRTDASTGAASQVATITGGGEEIGLAARGTKLYATNGRFASPATIIEIDPTTFAQTTRVNNLPADASSLEADPINGRFYFSTFVYPSSPGLYRADVDAGTFASLATVAGGYGNFAVAPAGDFLYARTGTTVTRYSATSGASSSFVTGLTGDAWEDLVFGPSSASRGYSLYVADSNRIVEVAGFAVPTLLWSGGSGNWTTANSWIGNLSLVSRIAPQNGNGNLPYLNATIAGGSVTSSSGVQVEALTISGGATVTIAANGTATGTSDVQTLTTTGGGKIDLKDNDLVIHGGNAGSWNGSNYTGVTGQIRSGRNGGAWNGGGLVTSMSAAAGANSRTTLGVASAQDALNIGASQTAVWSGQTVAGDSILVRYTWAGDANLSGMIDGDDYFRIDSGFASSLSGYFNGDFNYSGTIDADDYFLIDSNYSAQTGSLGLSAVAAVPEPASAAGAIMAIIGGALARARRRSPRAPAAPR